MSPETDSMLLHAAPAASVLFTAVWLVAGVTRPGYSPALHPVSSLALGRGGYWQVASFLVSGALMVVAALGLRSLAPALPWKSLIAIGLGLIGAGLFPTDPMNGYPAGTPPMLEPPTRQGVLHRVLSTPVFLGIPVHLFGWMRRLFDASEPRAGIAAAAALFAFCVLFVLMNAAYRQVRGLSRIAGLLQRACLVIGMGWIAATPWLVHQWFAR